MIKVFCDICGRPIETYKNVSKFKNADGRSLKQRTIGMMTKAL